MGHIKRKRPRRGSLSFWPRKRAKRIVPIIKNWARSDKKQLLGFAGYKAGMTAILFVDNRPKSPTKGEEIKSPVTVIEAPALKVAAVRLYTKTPYGLKVIGEVWAESLDKEIFRAIMVPKKRKTTLEDLKSKLPETAEARIVVYTQPRTSGLGKKKPDLIEIPVGGTVEEQFSFASSNLGREIKVFDVFKDGEFVDVHGISKGKGYTGDIKRFGIRLESHKAEFGRRHRATMGPETPGKVGWWIAQPGQMGFQKRTEYNKQIMKISNAEHSQVNPISGFSRYGIVKGDYVLVAGSVPGPKKRLVVLSHPIRPRKSLHPQAPEITHISTRSQQG